MTLILAGEISIGKDLQIWGFFGLWAVFLLPCIWLNKQTAKAESKRVSIIADRRGIHFLEIRNRLGLKVLGWDSFSHADTDGPALLLNIKPSEETPDRKQTMISCVRVGLLNPGLADSIANELNGMKASH